MASWAAGRSASGMCARENRCRNPRPPLCCWNRLRHRAAARRQVIPQAVVDDIRRGGDRAAFTPAGYVTLPGWSYRNMWWVTHNEHGAYMARGIHGQAIYVDPKAEMVTARYASHPLAANANNEPTSLRAYHALARHLMGATR